MTALGVGAAACGDAGGTDDVASQGNAVTFGADDRKNVVEFSAFADIQRWSNAVAVLGGRPGSDLPSLCHDTTTKHLCYWNAKPRRERPLPDIGLGTAKLCPSERFADEPALVDGCTAFRVGPRLFATAGHCLRKDEVAKVDECPDTEVAFGYRIASFNSETRKPATLKATKRADNVYRCTKVVNHRYDFLDHSDRREWTIFEVDRPVAKHRGLRIRRASMAATGDPLAILGHGLMLPQKISTTGVIRNPTPQNQLFYFSGDVFSGDSGAPTLDLNIGRVSGIVISTPAPADPVQFTFDSAANCYRYAPPCDPLNGCGNAAGDVFPRAMDVGDGNIQQAIPEPPANATLYAHLDGDSLPDAVSLETSALFYQVRVKLGTGTEYVIPTLIPAFPGVQDLSRFLHLEDFNGDGLTDLLVQVEGFPPVYVEGAAAAKLNPFSVAQQLLQSQAYTSFDLPDVNGDGLGDLQARTASGQMATFFGTPSGLLGPGGLAPTIEIPHECGENVVSTSNRAAFAGQAAVEYRATRGVAVVPGSSVGVPDAKTLLVIDCPGDTQKSQLKYLDPKTSQVRKTQALSTPAQWRALAFRQSQGDLIALSQPTNPSAPYKVWRIPLTTASSVAPVELHTRVASGIATGIGWDGHNSRIRVLVDATAPRIDHFAAAFQYQTSHNLSACGPANKPKAGGLAVSGSRDLAVCNGKFGVNYLNGRTALLDVASGGTATFASNTQRALLFHDVECDTRTFEDQLTTVVWGVSRSGRVIRAMQSDQQKCGFGGAAPLLAYCRKPQAVGQPEVASVSAGGAQSFIALADGRVYAAGENSLGQLGTGTATSVSRPVLVPALEAAVRVSTSDGHTLALMPDGRVLATGDNAHGQLGLPDLLSVLAPIHVPLLDSVVDVGAGAGFSVALTVDGSVWTWGRNDLGQLGSDSTEPRFEPGLLPLDVPIVQVAVGTAHVLARDALGGIWAWGDNARGQLGAGETGGFWPVPVRVLAPVRTGVLEGVVQVAAGGGHSLALLDTGSVLGWGANDAGQLGDSMVASRDVPSLVPGLPVVNSVAAGGAFSGARTSTGELWVWGANDAGQLGDGSTNARWQPARVRDGCHLTGQLTDVRSFAFGSAHALAVGSVVAWGNGASGQLGLGTTDDVLLPGAVILNESPTCTSASASPSLVWPPQGAMRDIDILGVVDPEGSAVDLQVLSVFQDEPQQAPGQGNQNPDAVILPGGGVRVRAERSGNGDGRVYHVRFSATDAEGENCVGEVTVCVPHHPGAACVDGGALYSSTAPPSVDSCTVDDEAAEPCLTCMHRTCCAEVAACENDARCSAGGPVGDGERECVSACLAEALDAGVDNAAALQGCEAPCASSGKKLSAKTRDLFTCGFASGTSGCSLECFGVP